MDYGDWSQNENKRDIPHMPPDDDHEIYDEEEEKREEELINRFSNDFKILLDEIKKKAQKYGFKERVPQIDNFLIPRKKDQIPVSMGQKNIGDEFFERQISPKNVKSWEKYKNFDFYIIVPKFISLGKYLKSGFFFCSNGAQYFAQYFAIHLKNSFTGRQTVDRFQSFINYKKQKGESFLQDLETEISSVKLDQHVLR